MQDKIVSHVWKNFTDTTKLFHSCEILLWNKISHALKNCFTCVKKISHVLKKFQNSFHMHSENLTCIWVSAVVFPTFHILLTWFSHVLLLVLWKVCLLVSLQRNVCLRYETGYNQDFLHEADMANILRHENILALYGVVIASSYIPSVALVSYL